MNQKLRSIGYHSAKRLEELVTREVAIEARGILLVKAGMLVNVHEVPALMILSRHEHDWNRVIGGAI